MQDTMLRTVLSRPTEMMEVRYGIGEEIQQHGKGWIDDGYHWDGIGRTEFPGRTEPDGNR